MTLDQLAVAARAVSLGIVVAGGTLTPPQAIAQVLLDDSLVVSTKSRVQLLASADRATHSADLGRVGTLLQFAGAHYRSTFLDVPRSEAAYEWTK